MFDELRWTLEEFDKSEHNVYSCNMLNDIGCFYMGSSCRIHL